MTYITSQSLTPVAFSLPSATASSFYDAPTFAVSRDGERLVVVPDHDEEPASAVLYMNAADSMLKTNPAGLAGVSHFSSSDAADRVLFDYLTVRDNGFNLIGSATLPQSSPAYTAVGGLVTPDGSRVYILAYRSDANSAPTVTPRVFVFDATTPLTNLPVLGYFDVADYPTCTPTANVATCPVSPVGAAISLDGRTLFFSGAQNLLVVPVPATLSSAQATALAQRRVTTVPWPVNVH
jgi:hypothetical protein